MAETVEPFKLILRQEGDIDSLERRLEFSQANGNSRGAIMVVQIYLENFLGGATPQQLDHLQQIRQHGGQVLIYAKRILSNKLLLELNLPSS